MRPVQVAAPLMKWTWGLVAIICDFQNSKPHKGASFNQAVAAVGRSTVEAS